MKPIEEKVRKFAHDIRNPLGGLRGLTELLQLKLENSPDLLKKTEKIISAATTVDQMITAFIEEMRTFETELENTKQNEKRENIHN